MTLQNERLRTLTLLARCFGRHCYSGILLASLSLSTLEDDRFDSQALLLWAALAKRQCRGLADRTSKDLRFHDVGTSLIGKYDMNMIPVRRQLVWLVDI